MQQCSVLYQILHDCCRFCLVSLCHTGNINSIKNAGVDNYLIFWILTLRVKELTQNLAIAEHNSPTKKDATHEEAGLCIEKIIAWLFLDFFSLSLRAQGFHDRWIVRHRLTPFWSFSLSCHGKLLSGSKAYFVTSSWAFTRFGMRWWNSITPKANTPQWLKALTLHFHRGTDRPWRLI